MFKKPFSFDGRIRRMEYWLSILTVHLILYIAVMAALHLTQHSTVILSLVVPVFVLPMYWFLFAQGSKRCHDCGFSGWWQLLLVSLLWMLFADGKLARNEYGDSPKDEAV